MRLCLGHAHTQCVPLLWNSKQIRRPLRGLQEVSPHRKVEVRLNQRLFLAKSGNGETSGEDSKGGDGSESGTRKLLNRTPSMGSSSWESLQQNASKAFQQDEAGQNDDGEMGADEERSLAGRTTRLPLLKGWKYWRGRQRLFTDRLAYQYFNWRKDSWQDVQLFVGINLMLLILGGVIKGAIVDALDGALDTDKFGHFWKDIYGVLVVVFGQELPEASASLVDQAFSLLVAFVGLATFALVLALVEQVVLENLESNVRTGSRVYEKDHILVLGWCENQRDEEVMWKVLSQICSAYRKDGGRCVVVLSMRPKVEMEMTFRRIIPEENRFRSRFVFRSGSPLVPSDLRRVAASEASATIVVADTSRSAEEADAQSLRCAVLLDELDFPGFDVPDPRKGHILVELKTAGAVKLMQYGTSKRVIAMPTAQLNARRISRMVRNPVVGSIDSMLLSFNSASQIFVEDFPQMAGKAFGDLYKWFPDGIPFGLVNQSSAEVKLSPSPSTFVNSGDSVLILRPNGLRDGEYQPAKQPAVVKVGEWKASDYVRHSLDELPIGRPSDKARKRAMSGKVKMRGGKKRVLEGGLQAGLFMLPTEYNTPQKILILGWGDASFMAMLLRELDRGPAALPRGSELTLFNSREGLLGKIRDRAKLENISMLHVQGNPMDQEDLRLKLDLARYRCVIVICDQAWLDPDLDARNGILMANEKDMLRLDSMIMMCQLNVREILEAISYMQDGDTPEVNIICEKVAFEGVTRFEDRYRLPLGISVNMSAFAATFLAESAVDPRILLPYSHMGQAQELAIQDVSVFAKDGEELSFWQLQARAASCGQVLYGTYSIPTSPDQPIDIVINPLGDETRSRTRVWNAGDSMRKVVTLAPRINIDKEETSSSSTQLRSNGDKAQILQAQSAGDASIL